MEPQIIGGIAIGLIVLIVIFLLLREVACWYWKINERLQLQKKQIQLLETLVQRSCEGAAQNFQQVVSDTAQKSPISGRICKKCNWENKPDDMFCSDCGNKL